MNPYGVDLSETNMSGPTIALEVLYKGMPETSGCKTCSEVNGSDVDWCCKRQNPSMFYVEFLHSFCQVTHWSKEKRLELTLRSIRNYLDNSLGKGCVFYDMGCLIYEQRPFACRMYGVTPAANWNKRWELLKERQQGEFSAIPQCPLVSADREITDVQEDKWFAHTKESEQRLGVPQDQIELHDDAGGSYRTFHDHLLLELLGPDRMAMLTNVRMTNPSPEDIEKTVEVMRECLNEV